MDTYLSDGDSELIESDGNNAFQITPHVNCSSKAKKNQKTYISKLASFYIRENLINKVWNPPAPPYRRGCNTCIELF